MIRTLIRVLLTGVLLSGCNRAPAPPPSAVANRVATTTPVAPPEFPAFPTANVPLSDQEQYEAALTAAFALFHADKLPEARTAFEKARALRDTVDVRDALAIIDGQIDEAAAAERVVAQIRALIDGAQPDAAADLAASALETFGDGPRARQFVLLKHIADALASSVGDPASRAKRLSEITSKSLQKKELRNLSVALQEAAGFITDSRLRRDAEDVQRSLNGYDELLRGARFLRRDPARLEGALAALTEAAAIWDASEVKRLRDELTLAVHCRRDRVGIWDFQVRGDPAAITIARAALEQIAVNLSARLDLVDRQSLNQVVGDLNISVDALLYDEVGRRELSKLLRMRYLVLGEASAISGFAVGARLIDLQRGVVVHSARVIGPTIESVQRSLPQLATMLLMNDENRLQYAARLAQLGPTPAVIAEEPVLAAEPEASSNAEQPVFALCMRGPETGAVQAQDLLAIPTEASSKPAASEHPVRSRARAVALEIGDNCFRRGLFRDAHSQYQIALSLSGNPIELMTRIERCRPYLPPNASASRPRVAVFDVAGSAEKSSRDLGGWSAESLASQLPPALQAIGREELNWYLYRLGLTLNDLIHDSAARFYLARALDARYLILGVLRSGSTGMEASAIMIDAEIGRRVSATSARAVDRADLRECWRDIARDLWFGTGDSPADAERCDALVKEARQLAADGKFSPAVDRLVEARKLRPRSVRLQSLQDQYSRKASEAQDNAAREAESKARTARLDGERAKRLELLKAVETAQKVPTPRKYSEIEWQRWLDQRHTQLVAEARAARAANSYDLADQLLSTAFALRPRVEVAEELGQVRAQMTNLAQTRGRRDTADREEVQRRQREKDLAALRARLDGERSQRVREEESRLQVLRDADRNEYGRLIELSRAAQREKQYETSLAALFTARRINPGDEVERLLASALIAQAREVAKSRSEKELNDLNTRLANDASSRTKLESLIRRHQNFHGEALKSGEQALRYRQFDRAIKQYQEALQNVRSDAALGGLRLALDEQIRAKATADAESKRAEADKKTESETARLIVVGRVAFGSGKFDEALTAFRQAKDLSPANIDAIAWLAKTEQTQKERGTVVQDHKAAASAATTADPSQSKTAGISEAKSKSEPSDDASNDPAVRLRRDVRRLVDQGRTAIAERRFDDAQKALNAALKLLPGDLEAKRWLAQIKNGDSSTESPKYRQHMQAGADLEDHEQFADATREYKLALTVQAKDPVAAARADFCEHMNQGLRLSAEGKKTDAAREFESALKIVPNDPLAEKHLRKSMAR